VAVRSDAFDSFYGSETETGQGGARAPSGPALYRLGCWSADRRVTGSRSRNVQSGTATTGGLV